MTPEIKSSNDLESFEFIPNGSGVLIGSVDGDLEKETEVLDETMNKEPEITVETTHHDESLNSDDGYFFSHILPNIRPIGVFASDKSMGENNWEDTLSRVFKGSLFGCNNYDRRIITLMLIRDMINDPSILKRYDSHLNSAIEDYNVQRARDQEKSDMKHKIEMIKLEMEYAQLEADFERRKSTTAIVSKHHSKIEKKSMELHEIRLGDEINIAKMKNDIHVESLQNRLDIIKSNHVLSLEKLKDEMDENKKLRDKISTSVNSINKSNETEDKNNCLPSFINDKSNKPRNYAPDPLHNVNAVNVYAPAPKPLRKVNSLNIHVPAPDPL